MSPTKPNSLPAPVEHDWYAHAFDALYPTVYAHRTVEAATDESAFAIDQLRLCDDCSVLDLCCGNGRHMVHLLRHTPHVAGLDYSEALLGFAREQVGPDARLVRADMRAIPFENAFDAIANFFTSFGYFQEDVENRAVAGGIARALKPGGRFFVDYLNPEHVRKNLEPESERDAGDLKIFERRWIDEAEARINKITEVYRGAERVSQSSESVRLYAQSELQALLDGTGLVIEARFGDYDGAPVGPANPRQIIVGRRE